MNWPISFSRIRINSLCGSRSQHRRCFEEHNNWDQLKARKLSLTDPRSVLTVRASAQEYGSLFELSNSIEEGYKLATGACIVNTEFALVRTGCVTLGDAFLRSPEDCLVIGVAFCHIAERKLRYFLRLRLFFISPDEGHDLEYDEEGKSRSAAVATAIYEFRGRKDKLRIKREAVPNPRVYMLACRQLGI